MIYGLKESLLNDLVSRKEVIRYIHKEMDEWINVDEPGDELAYEVEQIINEVPTVDIKNVLNIDSFDDKKSMTKEDWLHTLNTEQLAELIASICGSNILRVWRIMYHCADSDVDAVKMWLKQPHQKED